MYLSIGFFLAGMLGCQSSTYSPDSPTEASVSDLTANFGGLETELVLLNESWAGENPLPSDSVMVTVKLEVRNLSTDPQSFDPKDFELRTLIAGQPSTGPTWGITIHGRSPRIMSAILQPQEELSGWLTFEIPKHLYPEELVWNVEPDIALNVPLPYGGFTRLLSAIILGEVTDQSGEPVADARVVVTPVHPSLSPDDSSTFERCSGRPAASVETTTDASGEYELEINGGSSSVVCVDVLVIPPLGSGLAEGRRNGETIMPGDLPSTLVESPELRVDVQLQDL